VASVASDVHIADLPPYTRNQVKAGIVTDDKAAAEGLVSRLRGQAAACRAAATPTTTPTPSITPTPTSTKKPAKGDKAKTTPTPSAGSSVAVAGSTATSTASPTGTADPGSDGAATSEDCRGLG